MGRIRGLAVARGDSPRQARASHLQWRGLRDEDMPARYRRLCQQLALARSRGYSPVVGSACRR